MSDFWASYEKISKLKENTHLTVNHAYNFLDNWIINWIFNRNSKNKNYIKLDDKDVVQLVETDETDKNCEDLNEEDIEYVFGSLKESVYGSELGLVDRFDKSVFWTGSKVDQVQEECWYRIE